MFSTLNVPGHRASGGHGSAHRCISRVRPFYADIWSDRNILNHGVNESRMSVG